MTRFTIALFAIIALVITSCEDKKSTPVPEVCSCLGTTVIYKDDSVTVSIPTAFTPNGDGRNDMFRTITSNDDILENFQLSIVNTKGETLFSTTKQQEAWSGLQPNGGRTHPNGRYYYKMKFNTQTGQTVDVCGCLELLWYFYEDCLPLSVQNNVFEDQMDIYTGTSVYMSGENFCTD